MNKSLCLLLAAGITSVMAADDSVRGIVSPDSPDSSKKIERKLGDRELSTRGTAIAAVEKVTRENAEREKAEKISLISLVFPEVDTEKLDDTAIEHYAGVVNYMKQIITSHSLDSVIRETKKREYVRKNMKSPLILYWPQITTLVNAQVEVRKTEYSDVPGKTLEAVPVKALGGKISYYAGRVTDTGISKTTLQLLSEEKDNIIAVLKDCHTMQDYATHGLPVEAFTYHLYSVPGEVLGLMKRFPSVFEPDFKDSIVKLLADSHGPLAPLLYSQAHATITLRIQADEEIKRLEGVSSLNQAAVADYKKLYKDTHADYAETLAKTIVPLNVRWYDEPKEFHTPGIGSDTTKENMEALEKEFDANLKDGMALFVIEVPKAKKKTKKSGVSSPRPRAPSSSPKASSSSPETPEK